MSPAVNCPCAGVLSPAAASTAAINHSHRLRIALLRGEATAVAAKRNRPGGLSACCSEVMLSTPGRATAVSDAASEVFQPCPWVETRRDTDPPSETVDTHLRTYKLPSREAHCTSHQSHSPEFFGGVSRK